MQLFYKLSIGPNRWRTLQVRFLDKRPDVDLVGKGKHSSWSPSDYEAACRIMRQVRAATRSRKTPWAALGRGCMLVQTTILMVFLTGDFLQHTIVGPVYVAVCGAGTGVLLKLRSDGVERTTAIRA